MKHSDLLQNPYIVFKEGFGWVIKTSILKTEMWQNLLTVTEICSKYRLKIYHRYPTNKWHRINTPGFLEMEKKARSAAGMRQRGVANPKLFYDKYVTKLQNSNKYVIKLPQFYELFYTLGKTREEILETCKIGSKIWANTLSEFKRVYPKEFETISNIKHARSKFGNSFGRSAPEPLIPLLRLQTLVDKGLSKEVLKKKLNISDFILLRNLQYHNLEFSYYKNRKETATSEHIPKKEVLIKMEGLIPGILDKFKEFYYSDPTRVAEDLYRSYLGILNIQFELRKLGALVNARILLKKKLRKFSFTSNRGEYLVAISLLDSNIEFIHGFPLGEYFYDFFLPKLKTIIEVDGSSHNTKEAKKKDTLKLEYAKSKGYSIVRVPFTGKILKETQEFRQLFSIAKRKTA